MAPPLKSHLANERTFLEWIGMSIVLGTVSTGLISTDSLAAQSLGFCLAPAPIIFLLLSLWQYYWRKNLLNSKDSANDPALTSTTVALSLGAVLLVTQLVVLLFDIQGSLVKV